MVAGSGEKILGQPAAASILADTKDLSARPLVAVPDFLIKGRMKKAFEDGSRQRLSRAAGVWLCVLLSVGLCRVSVAAEGVPAKPEKSALKPHSELTKDPHSETPETRRGDTNALTEEVSRLLTERPRIEVKRNNYIDDHVFGKIERDKIPHAGLAGDQEFLRRVHLDLTGRIPSSEVVREFLADESPDKRDKLIDSLIAPERYAFSEEDPFVDRWTYWFSDLFSNSGGDLGTPGRNIFYDYIRMSLRLNVPYNRFVEEMLTASALTNYFSGPANLLARFHVDDATGNQVAHEDSCDEMAIETSRIFLGLNLECVSCHDGAGHLEELNLWLSDVKREQVWQMAAFFGDLTVYRPPPRRQEFTMIENGPGYDAEAYPVPAAVGYDVKAESVVRMSRWKADVSPTFLLSGEKPAQGENLRRAYARMVVTSPQFSKTIVNRIWAELMGVGIVDPPHDFDLARQDPSNPPPAPWTIQPSHPELLDALAKDLEAHEFDLRRLMKLITKSSAYQLSAYFDAEWKDEYARYFARRFVRRLSAEELFDAISIATSVFPSISINGTNTEVKYVMQTRSPEDLGGDLAGVGRFLGSFGQSNRSRGVKSLKGNIVQASLLLNSKIVKEKVKAEPGSRVHELLNQEPQLSNEEIVEELFLSVLSRRPSVEETKLAVNQIERYRTQGAEDVLWALLNKLDFVFHY